MCSGFEVYLFPPRVTDVRVRHACIADPLRSPSGPGFVHFCVHLQKEGGPHVVCMVMPDSRSRQMWDGIVVLLLVWTAIAVPLRIAFADSADDDESPIATMEVRGQVVPDRAMRILTSLASMANR